MEFDALLLSRIQFAFTIAFHIIFPSFTIGLASYLAVLEGLWLLTRIETFKTLYLFWVKIFALSFGMGVVSGVVMSYQLGTNWSVFSAVAGPVIGPLFAFEVLAAFFLEASFLGVMLFGWKKVAWGASYAVGLAAFMIVLLTIPKAWGEIPGDFVKWLILFGIYALVAVVIWAINARMLKKKPLPPEAQQGDQPDAITID